MPCPPRERQEVPSTQERRASDEHAILDRDLPAAAGKSVPSRRATARQPLGTCSRPSCMCVPRSPCVATGFGPSRRGPARRCGQRSRPAAADICRALVAPAARELGEAAGSTCRRPQRLAGQVTEVRIYAERHLMNFTIHERSRARDRTGEQLIMTPRRPISSKRRAALPEDVALRGPSAGRRRRTIPLLFGASGSVVGTHILPCLSRVSTSTQKPNQSRGLGLRGSASGLEIASSRGRVVRRTFSVEHSIVGVDGAV